MGELSDIEAELKKHASVLELGCGTGRLCAKLQELGVQATGVDESPAMLAHLPPGIEGIQGSVETLDLGRRWPAVLLPSHMINHPSQLVRKRLVEAARRHIERRGTFFVKRHSTAWLSTVQDGRIGESHGVEYHAENVSREGDLVTMTLRYVAFGQSWTQSFTTLALEKDPIEDLLSSCGFGSFKWWGKQELWLSASPSDA
jgi:SAM-dependent methyltransferase